jgi:regulator of replication initiation timing
MNTEVDRYILLQCLRFIFEKHDCLSCVFRSRIEQDFKGILQEKESENVRLRAEINRLRQALNAAQTSQTTQDKELQSLQQQMQAVTVLNK